MSYWIIVGIKWQYWCGILGHSMRFGKKEMLKKPILEQKKQILHLLLSHDPSHWDKEIIS